MVLLVLHPTAEAGNKEALTVDIVAVHGLNGGPAKTWENSKSKAFWLRDYLPLDIIGARVLSFGYNASAAFGNTTADVIDHARDLLSSLIDRREEQDALFQARIETQYSSINEHTIGIVFLGTPHRGSEKASYGKVLANLATTMMNKPTSRLVNALQVNSDSLMRLTSNFKSQLPNYHIVSFYEMRPMEGFSTLIVEKYSALLEVNGEDQVPVDADHRDMCKFGARDDPVYEKLFRRVRRMMKAKDVEQPSDNHYRENFWGIFWIDASNNETADRGFLHIARVCGLEEDSKVVKRWLSNIQDQWLLVIDNADNPLQDVSEYFPKSDRGVVLLTTRNPDCKIHSTVGSYEFGQMEPEEAITLLLNASAAGDVFHEPSRNIARPVVETLGYLALAIVQAGALIRQKLYSMEEYCGVYSRRRKELLSHRPIQAMADYQYTVYTTWEVSVNMIENMSNNTSNKTARNAIELLQLFCFMHFDGISEDILEEAWKNMRSRQLSDWEQSHQLRMLCEDDSGDWDPHLTREAVILLSSFSLIAIGGVNNHISMHPLMHIWARDRLVEAEQKRCWKVAASTLAMSIYRRYQTFDYSFRRFLLPHISSCLSSHNSELFTTGDGEPERLEIAAKFASVYRECGRMQEAMKLRERVLEARGRTLGEEHPNTLGSMSNLAISYGDLGRRQEAMELDEKVLEARERTLGEEHPDTLGSMSNLANSYGDLGRRQEAMELDEKVLEVRERKLGEEHPDTLTSMNNLAVSYRDLGRRQEAMELREKVLEARGRTLGEEHPDTLASMNNLAISYRDLGRRREAMELMEKVLEARERKLGEEHPDTLGSMSNLAISYRDLGQRQEAMELDGKVLEVRERKLGEEHPDTLTSMNNLAISYGDLGRRQEAMELMEKVLEAMERILGEEHPNTLTSMNNLAITYGDLGRRREAMELMEKVLKARERTLGEEHPGTLGSMSNLATSYRDSGRSLLAEVLEQHTSPENLPSQPHGTKTRSQWSLKSWIRRHFR
ncbi:hypothetical protein FGG08_003922 [Glutinoglossum americanum]|uniref:Kinesin light chain n=1 Tax=Glutinoglossum americanum TaxID=1670608 RepID=A0A9P8I6R4_9PEZI|nr:hypothetical protein FGG08_003922 [Glutinoglossum americanum]